MLVNIDAYPGGGLWLCKSGDRMTKREVAILEEARDGGRLMRVTALQMVMIKTLQ